MKISARLENKTGQHAISLRSGESVLSLDVPPEIEGFGSSVNGGEMLFLALATCYCNDIYREAKKRGMAVERVEVEISGEFGAEARRLGTLIIARQWLPRRVEKKFSN
jgi:uncharacterized OsmC-like protein